MKLWVNRVKAIILTGGYAKRLQPMSLRTIKPMMPVAGKPNITRIIESLKAAEIKEIIISMNVNQNEIKEYLGNGEKLGVKINYVVEETRNDEDKLGSVGALNYVIEKSGADDFVIVGCDQYYDKLDIGEMVNSHKQSESMVTIALNYLQDKAMVENLGIAVVDDDNIIKSFQEKPKIEEAKSRLASTLIYIINKEFFTNHIKDYLAHKKSKGEKPDDIGELWDFFAKKIKINGYILRGSWWDIGNIKAFLQVNAHAMDNNKTNGNKIGKNVAIGKRTRIINPVIIDDNCVIGSNSIIGPYTHIMRDSKVGDHCSIFNSVIFEKSEIADGVKIDYSVIDGGVKIDDYSTVHSYSNIGYKSKLGKNTRIFTGSKVWPFLNIGEKAIVEGKLKLNLENTKFLKELNENKYWNES